MIAPDLPRDFVGNITRDDSFAWPVFTVTPREHRNLGPVVYLHGGGFVAEIQPVHWNLITKLAAGSGRAFVVPIYPLAPAHSHRDVLPYLRDVYTRTAGTRPAAVMGDSAGGTLAMSLTQTLPDTAPSPELVVLFSPVLDSTATNPAIAAIQPRDQFLTAPALRRYGELFSGGDELTHQELSPINGPLGNLPPTTMFVGTRDIVGADIHRFAALATTAGSTVTVREYPDMMHTWVVLDIPEAQQALAEVIAIFG